ncbi:MAG: ROK family transcriptional regulator [Terriglobales bacterium]
MAKEPILIGRPSLLRQTNAAHILKLLRETGPCSRADLVRASGLSAPSVTNVVVDLAAAGLIEPIGEGESTGGRPPDMLRFKADRGCVAGVDINAGHLRFLLTDLNGRQLDTADTSLPRSSATPEAVCLHIGETIRGLLRKHKQKLEQLLAVVVGVPAITNVDEGVVLAISTLKGWRNVPLRDLLAKEFICPVIIENDTNLAAEGERYCGAARAEDNFVFISIGEGEGVGAGIILNEQIYHGSQWSAGEIGYLHVPHVSTGPPTIHDFGRLEKVLCGRGILKSWRARGKRAGRTKVNRGVEVFNLAAGGNAQARQILMLRARILTDVILNLSLILNPSLILLGGEIGSHPALLPAVKGLLKDSEFAVTRVDLGSLGPAAVLWGPSHLLSRPRQPS